MPICFNIYNVCKTVSKFEAEGVKKNIGTHLAKYVDCPNQNLKKTSTYQKVQGKGCTRFHF